MNMFLKKVSNMSKDELIQTIFTFVLGIVICLIATFLTSCGSTKVSVNRPNQGTYTTITVTTNNPISTQVNPQTSADINPFK